MCPEGVITFSTRIPFEPTLDGLKRMIDDVDSAAALLSSESISDLIVFCCTGGSLVGGVGYDEQIVKLIRDRAGVPAITITTAVIEALRRLGVERVAVATPYTADINEMERKVLNQYGFTITNMRGLHEHVAPGDFRNSMIGRRTPYEAYQIARSVDTPDAQAIFLSCTNFRTVEVIETLELDLGKPVISSNQAGMWLALRRLGVRESIKGYGKLLELG